MKTLTLAEAQSHFTEIVENLTPGEEIVVTRDDKPVATIRAPQATAREPPQFGTLKGTIRYVAPDFDEIPEGFEEYLP
jgi:antitoxin (DNA-binding transcriptional repressor) of toxin-antitoxin stability system